jgi:ethanolamine transporter EutH
MLGRIAATVGAIVGFGVIGRIFQPVGVLVGGRVAGNQLLPSDAAYLQFKYTILGMELTQMFLAVALLFTIFLIWRRPITTALLQPKETI